MENPTGYTFLVSRFDDAMLRNDNTLPSEGFFITFKVRRDISYLSLQGRFLFRSPLAPQTERKFIVEPRMLETNSGGEYVSYMLHQVNIPLSFHSLVEEEIKSAARGMLCAQPQAASTTGRRFLIRVMVLVTTYLHININPEEEDEVIARVSSMSINQTPPNLMPAASESSVRKLEKVRVEEVGTSKDDMCMICLEALLIKSEVTLMPCSHVYHGDCIVQWLKMSNLCPLCRFQMPVIDTEIAD